MGRVEYQTTGESRQGSDMQKNALSTTVEDEKQLLDLVGPHWVLKLDRGAGADE